MKLTLRTSRFQTWREEFGAPVRTTAGAPRFPLRYELAGHARLITPRYNTLKLPGMEFTNAYYGMLTGHGVEAIRAELAAIATAAGTDQLALLCYEDLSKPELWCHRTLFADWWMQHTGERVDEARIPTPDPIPTLF